MLNNLNKDWKTILKQELESPNFKALTSKIETFYSLDKEIVCLPEQKEIFNAFNLCKFEKLKVVILGQDPYPSKTHAHGLCFSVKNDVKPFPKSLTNVFKEIHSDLGIEIPENGNLNRWATQGVFLLNTILTIEEGITNSHKKIGWESFTDQVIKIISSQKEHVVFILWGNQAKEKEKLIDTTKHLVLKSVHPSPLSAYRGFYGCHHFSKTNSYLKKNRKTIINW